MTTSIGECVSCGHNPLHGPDKPCTARMGHVTGKPFPCACEVSNTPAAGNEALEALLDNWRTLETDFAENGRQDISHAIKRCRESLEATLASPASEPVIGELVLGDTAGDVDLDFKPPTAAEPVCDKWTPESKRRCSHWSNKAVSEAPILANECRTHDGEFPPAEADSGGA